MHTLFYLITYSVDMAPKIIFHQHRQKLLILSTMKKYGDT